MPVPAQPASRAAIKSASRSLVRSGSRSRAGAARRSTGASVLELQGLAGNRAVTQLLGGGGGGATAMLEGGSGVQDASLAAVLAVGRQSAGAPTGLQREAPAVAPQAAGAVATSDSPNRSPADLDVGFNPADRSHRLIIAIDQKEVRGDFAEPRSLRRHVDFAAAQQALAGLTAEQVRQVDDAYSADPDGGEGRRRLADDIFGGGGSGYRSDLDGDQLGWLRSLLGGSRASSPEDEEAAAAHHREADAYELHGLLFGDLEGPDIERIMAILRRSAGANEELIATYDRVHVTQLRADLVKMPPTELVRASMLLAGSQVAADAMKMAALKGRLSAIDERLAALTNVGTVEAVELAMSGGSVVRRYETEQLEKERRTLVDEIVERAGRAALEGRAQGRGPAAAADAEAGPADPTGAAGDLGAQSNVAAVVGDVNALATQVGGAAGEALRAVATADPGRRAAAELRKLSERGDLKADAITATLRGLREEAHAEVQRRAPGGSAAETASAEETLAKQYFDDLRADWNAAAGADGPAFDALLGTGSDTDADLNTSLAAGHGRLADVRELVLALQGNRKDVETVKRVLADKSADEINVLRMQYFAATSGRFLDVDLFGAAPTEAGGENPQLPTGDFLLPQGKATGSDRLTLEDYLQRPRVEGGIEEVLYLSGRAEREYEYTIANRGATGWWRDQWGNEARRLLDETITSVRQISAEYEVRAGWIPDLGGGGRVLNADWTRSSEAVAMLHQLRLARATIRGDRAAYEKATAALRSFFEAVAGFVLQVALTALLGPVAEAALGAELMEGVSTAARLAQWAEKTTVGIAATIGSNAAVMGSSYSWQQFKQDLAGGLGGAIGATALEKLAGPVATGLAAKLGTRCPPEIIKMAGTVGSIEGAAAAEGKSLRDDLSLQNIMKTHLLGKVASAGEETIREGLGVPVPKPRGGTPGADEERAPSDETPGTGGVAGERVVEGPDASERIAGADAATPTAMEGSERPVSMHLPEPGAVSASEGGAPAGHGPAAEPTGVAEKPGRAGEPGDFLDADESAEPPEVASEGAPEVKRVGMGDAGPARQDGRRHYTRASEQAEQARRAAEHPGHGRLIEKTARPDARARRRAEEFVSLDRDWPTLKPGGRLMRIQETLNTHLRSLGVPEIQVVSTTTMAPGRAQFDFTEWRVYLSEASIAAARQSPESFALLVSNVVHEGRHALHHFRGIRAAMTEGRFDDAASVPTSVKESARAANDSARAGSEADSAFAPGTPAYGEALTIYDQTHGPGKVRRKQILEDMKSARANVETRRSQLDDAVASGDAARIATARRNLRSAEIASQRAHNEYVALPQEIDAWRYGKATQAAVTERIRVDRALRARRARGGSPATAGSEPSASGRPVAKAGPDGRGGSKREAAEGEWSAEAPNVSGGPGGTADARQAHLGEVEPGRAPTDPFAGVSNVKLREMATTSGDAAQALLTRYETMARSAAGRRRLRAIERRATTRGEPDEIASYVLDEHVPKNTAYERIRNRRRDRRMRHEATAKITDDLGQFVRRVKYYTSGGVTRELREQLGSLEAGLATHTEVKAIIQARLEPGQTLWIHGQYDPCSSCRDAMTAASEGGRTVDYWWPGGHFRAENGVVVIGEQADDRTVRAAAGARR